MSPSDLSWLVLTCSVVSCHFLSSPDLSWPVLLFPVISCRFLLCPVVSCRFLSFPVISCCFLSFPVVSCHFPSFPVLSWPFLACPDMSWPFLFWTELSVCLFVCESVCEFQVYWDASKKLPLKSRNFPTSREIYFQFCYFLQFFYFSDSFSKNIFF